MSIPVRRPVSFGLVIALALVFLLDCGPRPFGAQPSSRPNDRKVRQEVLQAPQTQAGSESTRSAPPDTTPYSRPPVPEDYAPGGRPAICPDRPEVFPKCSDVTRESPLPSEKSRTEKQEKPQEKPEGE